MMKWFRASAACAYPIKRAALRRFAAKSNRHAIIRSTAMHSTGTLQSALQFEREIKAIVDEARSLGIPDVYDIKYSKHFGPQSTQYIPNLDFDHRVVDEFVRRQSLRATCKAGGTGCAVNPLVTLPTTSGCGKSRFLVHFPQSTAYTQYAISGNGELPVVALLSFSNFQQGGPKGLGLRLAYGCLKSMGLIPHHMTFWRDFGARYQSFDALSGLEVLRILRSVFGTERKFFIGVDSMYRNRADNPTQVLRELGEILDNDGSTDVIVSTLAPPYLQTENPEPQREIVNLPIPPCATLWRCEEYAIFAREMIERARAQLEDRIVRHRTDTKEAAEERAMFDYKSKVITAGALLAGGHPGTVSRLLDYGDDNRYGANEWDPTKDIEAALANPHCTAASLLHKMLELSCFTEYLRSPAIDDNEHRYFVSTGAYSPFEDAQLRKVLDCSRSGAIAHMSGDKCKVYTTLKGLFSVVRQCSSKQENAAVGKNTCWEHNTQLLMSAFGGYGYWTCADDVSDLWVRARALTLALRAYELPATAKGGCEYLSFATMSGAPSLTAGRTARRVSIESKLSPEWETWKQDLMVWTGDRKDGYEVYLCGYTEQWTPALYCEAVLTDDGSTDLLTAMAKKVKHMLANRPVFKRGPGNQEPDVYCAFSRYADPSPEDLATLSCNKALLQRMTELMEEDKRSSKGEQEIRAWRRARQYVRSDYKYKMAVLHKRELDETTPPTLLPLASLVQHMSDSAV